MAELCLTDAEITINTVDLSDYVRSVTINYKAETPEAMAMAGIAKARLGGLLDWGVDIEFNQDYAAAAVEAILAPLVGVPTTLIIKPTSGAVSATNPAFAGDAILSDYDSIVGKVGDVAIAKAKFAGSGVLTRAVSPYCGAPYAYCGMPTLYCGV